MDLTLKSLQSFVPCLKERGKKILLHVGAGSPNKRPLPECFRGSHWAEVRVDIDQSTQPHIVASVTNMTSVPDGGVHGVLSSHTHEHLNDHEVPQGFSEIYRVLKPGGVLVMNVPDLAEIAKLILQDKIDDVLYQSNAGPVRPIDMLFGHQPAIQRGSVYMAHRSGFTSERLARFSAQAGFTDVRVRKGKQHDLWLVAVK
jgi:ubiquinone/menaquinone biosynthesis C-methylase UbiE